MLTVQRVPPETGHRVHVQHFTQVVVVQHIDLLNLMAGAETVKEMHEGHPGLDGGEMGHGGQVHALLHAGGGQLGEARLTAGHHIGVVAENGKGAGAHGPGRHMDHARQQLAGDAVQGRDHQHQALGGGVAGGQSTGLQGAVHGAAGAGLALHLHQPHRLAEDVLAPVGGPGVHVFRHGAGGCDGINRCDFGKRIACISGGFIAVHGFLLHC